MTRKNRDIEIFYNTVAFSRMPILAYDEKHLATIEKLQPLIACPWLLGLKIFINSQWGGEIILDEVGVHKYDIPISKQLLKACKYHEQIILTIYELLKEIYVLKQESLFECIPRWLGLVLHDFISYRVHQICIKECLETGVSIPANRNLKKFLIHREEKFLNNLENGLEFKKEGLLQPGKYKVFEATNKFVQIYKDFDRAVESRPTNLQNKYRDFIKAYKEYLKTLHTKLWCVLVVDQEGKIYKHETRGSIPKYKRSNSNNILFTSKTETPTIKGSSPLLLMPHV